MLEVDFIEVEQERELVIDDWIRLSKEDFANEAREYNVKITDEHWEKFGIAMWVLRPDGYEGTESRSWYRAFAQLLEGGKEYAKEVILQRVNATEDSVAMIFGCEYHMLELITYGLFKLGIK